MTHCGPKPRIDTMDYRREIDGLRALAVLPVILFHAGFEMFSGGFVGVDVFFVISGYLITTIILDDLECGKFSIVNFYERRARRILPALFLVMLVCLPFAWLWLLPSEMKLFAKSVFAVSLFSSNILFWRESGYFDTATELKPLLHTWSLAVEEQYYILFPVFLLVTWRFGRRWVLGTLAVVAVASLVAAQWGSTAKPAATFFLLPTRGWELLLGAFVAFHLRGSHTWQPSIALREVCGVLGLAMFVYAVFAFSKQTPFPSFYALLPTVGTALIILFATQETTIGRFIGNKLFVGIGLISYSAYLWHQPIFAFARHRSMVEPGKLLLSALAIASVVLAYFSWKYIEIPFRRKRLFNRKQMFTFGAAVSVAYLAFGLVGYATKGHFYRADFTKKFDSLEHRVRVNHGLSSDCEDYYTESSSCKTSENPEIMVWGDSFAMHLVDGLIASNPKVKFIQSTVSVCGPFFDVAPVSLTNYGSESASKCLETNDKVRSLLERSPSIKYVVLSSPFEQFVGKQARLMKKDGSFVDGNKFAYQYFIDTLNAIKDMGKVPIVFSPTPSSGFNTGRCLIKSDYFNEDITLCDFDEGGSEARQEEVVEFLREVSKINKVVFLSDGICKNKVCKASVENIFIYRDGGHLSHEGSAYVGKNMNFYRLITTD